MLLSNTYRLKSNIILTVLGSFVFSPVFFFLLVNIDFVSSVRLSEIKLPENSYGFVSRTSDVGGIGRGSANLPYEDKAYNSHLLYEL